MRIEGGVVVGSNGKYENKNPIAQYLLARFDEAVICSINESAPSTVLEIGCGEGHVTELILSCGITELVATDISVSLVKENSMRCLDPRVSFVVADLISFEPCSRYDLVVCCEVLEHLVDPLAGVEALYNLGAKEYVLSVPREPIWRILNMARGAYFADFGNSPGHFSHFTKTQFISLVENRFNVLAVRSPLPWTVIRCSRK